MTELQLISQIHEKIYKKVRSRSGKTITSKKLIGHIIAGVIENEVVIGYSLVHKLDSYNVIKGKRVPGHGKHLAIIRAIKWRNNSIIMIPPKIVKQMKNFIKRCDVYYKDRNQKQVLMRSPMPQIPADCEGSRHDCITDI